ncbi:lysozyme inhibitor LprI family protein [Phenylobacterium sp. LjRoot219]|uniref:lysozyme inhibitor LprI family protein n=1 Tax=Phenylobacterium sp. LjRoot219 TaxID=3342283 RepID=UPI003ECDEB2D
MIVGGVVLTLGLGILAGALSQPGLTGARPIALPALPSLPELPALPDLAALTRAPPPPQRVATPAPAAPHLPAPLQSVLPASIPVTSVLPQAPPDAAPAPAPLPAAAAAAPPAPSRMRVAVAPTPRPAPLPETGGRLTLPPEMTTPTPAPTAPLAAPAQAPAAQVTASFDCAAAGPGAAEQMVCSDPELAAADRELANAYGRARRSGAVDPAELDLDQRDWAALREDAARYSRRALVSVYAHRIDVLNEIADDGAHDDDQH